MMYGKGKEDKKGMGMMKGGMAAKGKKMGMAKGGMAKAGASNAATQKRTPKK